MKKAMLLSAGLGTRLKPFTLKHPKALAPVNGKPLLQRNIEYLKSFGVEEVVVNVHHFADQIISFLKENDFGIKTTISDETDEVLETGGGLVKARPFLADAEHFFVMNVDILTDLDLNEIYDYHVHQGALVSLAVCDRESSRGLLFNDEMQLSAWQNKKTGELKSVNFSNPQSSSALRNFSFSGIQVVSSEIFPLIKQEGKFSIIDTYLELAATQKIIGYDHSGKLLMDVGKPESILLAEKIFL